MNRSAGVFSNPARRRFPLLGPQAVIIGASLLLSALGIAFVHSTTAEEFEGFPSLAARSQMVKLAVAIGLFAGAALLDYRWLERFAYAIYGVVLVVLAALLAAKAAAGEDLERWFDLGYFAVQPSELAKLTLVLALARYLRFRSDQRRIDGLIGPLALTVAPMVLVVVQPDLGASLMLPPVLLALLMVAGAKRWHLAVAIAAVILMAPGMVLLHNHLPRISGKILHEYQMQRLLGFFHQDEKSWGMVNYQLHQSLIAFGSGGPGGKGFLEGTQHRRGFLPACHTDFIFAVVGEELGFRGSAALVLLYLVLVLALLTVSLRSREPFARLVSAGVATLFAAQGLENFGMTLGLTPITGIPLPFVSFGGSSLVTSFLAAGVVVSIASRRVRVVASPDLSPEDPVAAVAVIDEHPAGANRFPNSAY
jgi:rod shape determining protein RodA